MMDSSQTCILYESMRNYATLPTILFYDCDAVNIREWPSFTVGGYIDQS